jgi:hypothetical protein
VENSLSEVPGISQDQIGNLVGISKPDREKEVEARDKLRCHQWMLAEY